MGVPQQGPGFSNNPQPGTPTSFQTGMSGPGIGQQTLSRPETGLPSGTQPDFNMSQFLSGISPPGIMPPGGSTAGSSLTPTGPQGTQFSGNVGMSSQTQGSSSATGQGMSMSGPRGSSFPTGLSMPSGMPSASQPASPNIVDLVTRGQGLTFGTQDFSSQIRDLTSQPQGFPTQTGTGNFRSGTAAQQQIRDLTSQPQGFPTQTGTGNFRSGTVAQQPASGQSSQNRAGSGQSWVLPSGQSSVSQPGMDTRSSQFQGIGMSGFVSSSSGQSSFGLQNTFQNSASLGQDSSMGTGREFGQTPGRPSVPSGPTAAGQPGILTPPGFSRNSMSGSFDRQQSIGGMSSSQRFETPSVFSGPSSRSERPLRLNTDQPSTRMQPLDRDSSFSGGRGMPDMGFGMGARGMTDFSRGMPEMRRRPDEAFPNMSRTAGIGGTPDMRLRADSRGMIDILRSRGMPFMDPRASLPDLRVRGMGPGIPGPSRFPPPGMAPRGIPPPALLERLRMLRRMRGF